MIFSYHFVTGHPLEILQTYIEHTVLEVWCKPSIPFDPSLLHPDFRPLVDALSDNLLRGPIERIYEICRTELTSAQRDRLREGFIINNQIEELCTGRLTNPLRYSELSAMHISNRSDHKSLRDELDSFFSKLYIDVLNRASIKQQCGSLLDHFQLFVKTNLVGKCAFCGIDELKGEYQSQPHDLTDPASGKTIRQPGKRDAYDHYLPKGVYPFSSVNLHNLAPACYNCNSAYKLANDPIRGGRKTFYPYSAVKPDIKIRVTLATSDLERLTPADVSVTFSSATQTEELDTWKDVFGTEIRYVDKLSKRNEVKAWLQLFRGQCFLLRKFTPALTVKDCLDAHLADMRMSPEQDNYFLKIPFLEACYLSGVMQDMDNL